MIRKFIFLFLSLFLFSSCYTMYFSKENSVPISYKNTQWHHIGLLGLWEFSDPVNLKKICPKGSWESIRVRTGLLQGLVRYIPLGWYQVNNPIPIEWLPHIHLLGFTGLLYSPEEVSVSCSKKQI